MNIQICEDRLKRHGIERLIVNFSIKINHHEVAEHELIIIEGMYEK